MQRRRLALCEREREKLLQANAQHQRPPCVTGSDIKRTLEHLDMISKDFRSPAIKTFLTQIRGVVSGLHGQLMDAHTKIQKVMARNAVLQVCLDRALHEKVLLQSADDALFLHMNHEQERQAVQGAHLTENSGGKEGGAVGNTGDSGCEVSKADGSGPES